MPRVGIGTWFAWNFNEPFHGSTWTLRLSLEALAFHKCTTLTCKPSRCDQTPKCENICRTNAHDVACDSCFYESPPQNAFLRVAFTPHTLEMSKRGKKKRLLAESGWTCNISLLISGIAFIKSHESRWLEIAFLYCFAASWQHKSGCETVSAGGRRTNAPKIKSEG